MVARNLKASSSARDCKNVWTTGDPVVVLLVDDDADCRCLVRDAITEQGITDRVYEVSNGFEALHFLQKKGGFATAPRPNLIVLDLEMPGLTGHQVLQKIMADPYLRDIPVVMMSGVSDEKEMQKALLAGADRYVVKPASSGEFMRVVTACTRDFLSPDRPSHGRAGGRQLRRA